MKRIILLVLLACVLTAPVAAVPFWLTFQDPADFSAQISLMHGGEGTGNIAWAQNTTGGNSYVQVAQIYGYGWTYMINAAPYQTTYAAATYVTGECDLSHTGWSVRLFDSNLNSLWGFFQVSPCPSIGDYTRIEIKMIGGQAYVYVNGAVLTNSTPLSANPLYIGFGSETDVSYHTIYTYWDDFVYGTPQTAYSSYIFDAPYPSLYCLKKDFINPAASGLVFCNNGTTLASTAMFGQYGKGNGNAEDIVFQNYGTGQAYLTHNTGTNYAEQFNWNLNDFLASAAPYGWYASTVSGTARYSERIAYIGWGADISWDLSSYNQGQTGTVTYTITPSYWDTSTYTYKIVIMDVYGNTKQTTPISSTTGTVTYAFTTSDNLGVYYAIAIADPIAAGDDIWMNFAYTSLTAYMTFTGHVYNAINGTAISGAHVNFTQGSTVSNTSTTAIGAYSSASTFLSGITTYRNTTSAGYQTDAIVFTPLRAQTLDVDIPLIPTSVGCTGICLYGLDREPPYYRPVSGATIFAENGTEYHTNTTNTYGLYLFDGLINATTYKERGYKIGYQNSSDYYVQVIGT